MTATLAMARPAEGCAPAADAQDTRAREVARLNALADFARATGTTTVTATESVRDERIAQDISGVTVVKTDRARIVKAEYLPAREGSGRICVTLELD